MTVVDTPRAPQAATARNGAAPQPVETIRVWWLSPVWVTLFVGGVSILSAALVSDNDFRVLWRTPKWITAEGLLLFGCGSLALAFGALVAIALTPVAQRKGMRWPVIGESSLPFLAKASTVFTGLTVIGYVGFGVLFLKAGINPLAVAGGAGYELDVRSLIGTIPGVTTLTQFGIPAVVLSAVLLANRYSRTELVKLLLVVALAGLRALMFFERLAILELVVPALVVLAGYLATRGGKWARWILQLMPVMFIGGVVLIFGLFEYVRSWTYYGTHGSQSYFDFVVSRIAGYYATALNNGDLMIEHLQYPGRVPYHTMEALWLAPGLEKLDLYLLLGGNPRPIIIGDKTSSYDVMLAQFGNPEFNNNSGYASVFADYGTYGGIVFFLLLGLAAGFLYSRFCTGNSVSMFGLFLYPIFFVGLLELPRYFYWSQGRATPAWVGLIVLAIMLARREARERRKASELCELKEKHVPC